MAPAQRVAQVLLDTSLPQLDHLFDYAIPVSLEQDLRVGQRVKVPLRAGARQAFGYVVRLGEHSEYTGELSAISEIVSSVPLLTPSVYTLARKLADRAAGSANDILRLAIPARQVRVEKQFLAEFESVESAFFAWQSHSTPQDKPATPSTHPAEDSADDHSVDDQSAGEQSVRRVSRLTPSGTVRLSSGEWVPAWAEDVARQAVEYFGANESVIIAVPDQYDLHFVLDALRVIAPDAPVTRVDSHQSNADRYRNFLDALTSLPRIILGNRSAVYAPAFQLGAIVVWDDADALFEEPLSPYVHTRDAALMRSALEGCDLIVASNVRSLEVQRLIELGYVTSVGDTRRKTAVVTGMLAGDDAARGDRLPDVARRLMREALERGPVLVQVLASGFATAVVCSQCKKQQRCLHCQGPLQRESSEQHAALKNQPVTRDSPVNPRFTCRWCGLLDERPTCASCLSSAFRDWGAGAATTEKQLMQLFGDVPVKRSGADNRLVLVDSRPQLVVCTRGAEPLAAGGYAAVVLLDVDAMLSVESLGAEIEAYRGWVNAAALAAPESHIVMVGRPSATAQSFALSRDAQWITSALHERQVLKFPPAVRTASFTGPAPVVEDVARTISSVETVEVLRTMDIGDGSVRTDIRFGYNVGVHVALELRKALVSSAARSRTKSRNGRTALESRLRVHMDDPLVFEGDLLLRKRRAVRR